MAKKKRPVVQTSFSGTIDFLEVTYIDVDALYPNEYNPNRQSDHEFELLCRSIEEDGFTQPILAHRDTFRIIDGEHRWRACKALGLAQVPVCLTTMSEVQSKIATLRHNRARGNEDIQLAADVMRQLQKGDALDWATDSLILNDTEVSMMLDMIPKAELNLRTEKMDFDTVQNTLDEEHALVELKHQEEVLMSKKDNHKYTIQFTFLAEEALIVKAVVGKEHAAGVLALCATAIEKGWIAA